MEEETESLGRRGSVSALLIFIIVLIYQYATRRLQQLNKDLIDVLNIPPGRAICATRPSVSPAEIQLRKEIKQLLEEANSFSQPSTFAQAAKLRRLAAAKEKELAKCQESNNKEMKSSIGLYLKALQFSKIAIFFLLVCWYWGSGSPVAAVSRQLLQPCGGLLSFAGGGSSKDYVMVGIIPWLAISTRVSKFICGLLK